MIEFYNRTFYWLYVLEIPHIRGKELVSAIKIKLNSLYPGNIADCNIQIRKNGSKKWSYLVFVLNKNTGNRMLPLSPLFIQYLFAHKTADALYVDKRWLDHIRIENGAVISSTVRIRNDDVFLEDVNGLCGTETDLLVYCDKTDREILSPLQENKKILFFDNKAELKKIDIHKISLFNEKSPVVKRRNILAAAAVLFFLITFSWLLYQHRKNENELNALLRLEQEQAQKAALEQQGENQRLSQLMLQYQEIIASKTATPFDIAVVISECADQQTRIQSATFNGSFFQIEGLTNSSLGLLNKFENHRLVRDARLHQVHPLGNMDTFTLSGTVQTETASVDESLPAGEQIAILENLIAAETGALSETQLSPSAFGESVNALFTKWGCTAGGYQFMNEPQKTEIEISLRGPGNGFFNALYEIKTRHRLWDVHLTQIRNLFPRNLLDIVVRIRTEYVHSQTEGTNAAHVENIDLYPVANISRNYFVPSQTPSIPAQRTVSIEQTPVVTPPLGMERVPWLEYIGSVYEDDERFVYVKDTRTGIIMKLGQHNEGNMRYAAVTSGGIIAYINEHIYEINRR